jgi:hypothetical protein
MTYVDRYKLYKNVQNLGFYVLGQMCFICFIFQIWFDVIICIKNILPIMY